jgi:putative membrane protein insertion efficiency factor
VRGPKQCSPSFDRCVRVKHPTEFGTRWFVGAFRAYQGARAGRISPCRFYPSCSAYGVEALETHGVARGLWLTSRRILRCRPGGPSGIDLVPTVESSRKSGKSRKSSSDLSISSMTPAASLKVQNHA